MNTDAKMSYDQSIDSRPQICRMLADSLHIAWQGNAVILQSANHLAMVGRMENFVVGEGNRWGMFLMWQLQSGDQNHVCRPINLKKSELFDVSILQFFMTELPSMLSSS